MNEIKRVVVCGVGAAGSNFLLNLINTHPGLEYTCIDDDVVELRNYEAGTQPYGKGDLRRPKVQALQRIVQAQRGVRIQGKQTRIKTSADIASYAGGNSSVLIVDAFDNPESRNLFLDLGDGWNIMHVGFSALLTGTVIWNETWERMESSPSDAEIDVCQMHMARPFIHALSAMAAIVAAKFIETGEKRGLYFDSTLKIIKL